MKKVCVPSETPRLFSVVMSCVSDSGSYPVSSRSSRLAAACGVSLLLTAPPGRL